MNFPGLLITVVFGICLRRKKDSSERRGIGKRNRKSGFVHALAFSLGLAAWASQRKLQADLRKPTTSTSAFGRHQYFWCILAIFFYRGSGNYIPRKSNRLPRVRRESRAVANQAVDWMFHLDHDELFLPPEGLQAGIAARRGSGPKPDGPEAIAKTI